MSKNFELLRQAGFKQDYFDDLPAEPPTPTAQRINPPGSNRSTSGAHLKQQPGTEDHRITALVRRIFLDVRNPNVRCVVFSGVAPLSGCTRICAQTSRTLASLVDGTVCVVDTNFGAPGIARQFSRDSVVGFSEAVLQGKPARNFVRQIDASNLHVLSAGEERVRVQADGANVAGCLRQLRRDFDYVLIDAPPLSRGSIASNVSRAGDGAILVLESQGIALGSLLRAKQHLRAAHVPLLGVILNECKPPAPSLFGEFFK